MSRAHPILALALVWSLSVPIAGAQSPSFVAFESGPVRPLALAPDGSRLYVANTPDNRLEVFSATGGGFVHVDSIPVGMEPVALAVHPSGEIWVVNHLSDSVSILADQGDGLAVTRTLLVGDEPRDIVFAGAGSDRAFVTTAHRGQHRTHGSISGVPGAGDPQLTTPSVPRADVWVFDRNALGSTIGGTPLEIVELFADTPRALAVSPDGGTVYAAAFHSGNRTAVVNEGAVCDGFQGAGPCSGDGITSPNGLAGGDLPGGNPGPDENHQLVAAPEVGLVVHFDEASGEWQDELGRNWSNGIRFHLPDHDVFAIDAATLAPVGTPFSGVGTILFNMAVNPVNGNVYVSNTDAQNLTRFEGAGTFGGSTVQGNLAQSHITVIDGGVVKPRHVNRHIDYGVLPAPGGVEDHSLATPLQMVVSSDGSTLYVAAFGSGKVGVFDTADLEDDSLWDLAGAEFDPTAESVNYIDVTGGGPSGLVLDEPNDRLYVSTRFDNGLSVVDLSTGTELYHLNFHNPEPDSVVEGRFMLYDAVRTSSNGEASCSSCHVFGDFDSLAWDLGDPDGNVSNNPMPINLLAAAGDQNGGADNDEFHPMKGPMTTQTLRGLANSGPMHWRGDRADGFFGLDGSYSGGSNDGDEELSFNNFIVAFPGLVGLDEPPTDSQLQADMQKFTDFMLQVQLPPNPVRALDNSLNASQQAGRDFFFGDHGGNDCADGVCINFPGLGEGITGFSCQGCHELDPAQGFFGTGAFASFENEDQIFKIPHLRNMYQKVGMFGMPDVGFNNGNADNSFQGDQVRGTGYLHDGSTDTLFTFFTATVFNDNSGLNAGFDGGDPQRRDVEQFMLAFDTDLAPVVGQQVTLNAVTLADPDTVDPGGRLDLLEQRAGAAFVSKALGGNTTECDLVVKGRVGGEERGWLYDPGLGQYEPDSTADPFATRGDLLAVAAVQGQELTFTCVPPGSGVRVGLDRDEDGFLDHDERLAKTDIANAGSAPGACNDGIDNDGDGAIDLADAGCAHVAWNIENPQCSDGVNNDGDGLVDLADPHCSGPSDNRERPNSGCGLTGFEALPLLGLLAVRRRARGGSGAGRAV